MPFDLKHLTSTKQLTRDSADEFLRACAEMEKALAKGGDDRLKDKILASLFFEPSTRTRLSFETAMHRLGGDVITTEGIQFSSMYKGESIEDTIMMAGQYADIIAMRHPEQGSADRAAAVSPVPFINAGDGPAQHPTQALLDFLTIQKELGRVKDLKIAMVGDMLYGRTVHSLCFILGLYEGIEFTFISPDELKMPTKVTDYLKDKGLKYTEADDIEAGLGADIIYMTRVQEERFVDKSQYERLKLKFILQADHVKGKEIIVMHPLPRVGEIAPEVDALPNAAYFRQAKNGVVARMALLALLLRAV